MLWLCLIGITCVILILGSTVPIIQFLLMRKNRIKKFYTYSFNSELFDMELDSVNDDRYVSRAMLSMRGWIRGPQGDIMTQKTFQKKREDEYSIDLP